MAAVDYELKRVVHESEGRWSEPRLLGPISLCVRLSVCVGEAVLVCMRMGECDQRCKFLFVCLLRPEQL